jgi:arabinan endo-1,5-alpha-L-arabinosidase
MRLLVRVVSFFVLLGIAGIAQAQSAATPTPAPNAPPRPPGPAKLADIRLRDSCILPDEATKTYYLVSAGRRGPNGRATVVQYTSKDLEIWDGPRVVFEIPENWWSDRGIWAPEIHAYQGKYFLFLTFDSSHEFPEQWRNWRPRVKRGSQVLWSDKITGPFQPFENRSTLPPDMMTLDGTLWVEDGVPYMVFCHEWVQIKDGTVEMVKLKPDLSATDGEPVRLFHGSDAPWAKKSDEYGCYVTDGSYLYRSKTGKLLMVWSSFSTGGYTTGVAISKSDKLAGPWIQQAEPIYTADGGHPMIFRRFDGQLMLTLHTPNNSPLTRQKIFEIEDLGDTLRVKKN